MLKLKLFSRMFYLVIMAIAVCCGKKTEPSTGPNSGGSGSGNGSGSSGTSSGCGTHNGHQLYKGSSGGCYYYNSNGNKTYVDASECHC